VENTLQIGSHSSLRRIPGLPTHAGRPIEQREALGSIHFQGPADAEVHAAMYAVHGRCHVVCSARSSAAKTVSFCAAVLNSALPLVTSSLVTQHSSRVAASHSLRTQALAGTAT
jgi:hypothetical protein